jgi:hypothetical protein
LQLPAVIMTSPGPGDLRQAHEPGIHLFRRLDPMIELPPNRPHTLKFQAPPNSVALVPELVAYETLGARDVQNILSRDS